VVEPHESGPQHCEASSQCSVTFKHAGGGGGVVMGGVVMGGAAASAVLASGGGADMLASDGGSDMLAASASASDWSGSFEPPRSPSLEPLPRPASLPPASFALMPLIARPASSRVLPSPRRDDSPVASFKPVHAHAIQSNSNKGSERAMRSRIISGHSSGINAKSSDMFAA
jgi:hypothetical protein